MAYLLHYERKYTRIQQTEDGEVPVGYLQKEAVYATDANYDIQMEFAKNGAYNGEVTVEEVEDEETEPTSDSSVWDELDKAYQEGVNGAYAEQ